MAKKNTSPAARTINPTTDSTSSAPKRRRTLAKGTAEAAAPPSVADDRAAAMPEPAGQRVTPADTAVSDSVTFVGVEGGPSYEQIAEAAYLRYLDRGASDGQDFEDWIEAERALKNR